MHALLTTSLSAVFSMHIYCTCVLCGMPMRREISCKNTQTSLHRGTSHRAGVGMSPRFYWGVKGRTQAHPGPEGSPWE